MRINAHPVRVSNDISTIKSELVAVVTDPDGGIVPGPSKLRVLIGLAMLLSIAVPAAAADGRVKPKDSALAFGSNLERALELAKSENKPIYLAFGAAWCPVCRRMEEQTLLELPMQALAEDFIWVKIDIDRHVTLAREWGVEATPSIFLLDSKGNAKLRIIGGAGAEELASMLREFLDGLGTAATPGEPVPDQTFPNTALTEKPGGFRGRSICFSHVGYGPLSVRSQSAFQSLRLGIMPRTPSTLARGEHQVRVGATWANQWANDDSSFDPDNVEYGRYLLDYESLDADFSYAQGVSDTVQLEIGYEQRWRAGGVMDSFVQGFHDLFGLDPSGRDLVPRDQFRIMLDPYGDGRSVDLGAGSSGTFARNLLFTFQHNVTCGTATWPALSYAVTGRYGVGEVGEAEGGNWDVALSVAASRRFGRFYAYLTLGYAWYSSDTFYGIELEDTQFTILAAGEWRFKPRMSLMLQIMTTQGVAVDFDPFSKTSNEVIFGWKWEVRQAGVLEIGLLENIVTFDNSPDFGVHAAFTQRF
jgi:thiol-disulfide isomerase/thioredoxin